MQLVQPGFADPASASSRRGRLWMAVALTVVTLVVGCSRKGNGPDVQFVEGRVLLDGEPLALAYVGFNPDGGEAIPAGGQTDDAGFFKLTSTRAGARDRGATMGRYVVTVRKFRNLVAELGDRPDPDAEQAEQAKFLAEERRVSQLPPESLIPKVYGDKTTSPLRAEVKKGRNTFTFELLKDVTPAK